MKSSFLGHTTDSESLQTEAKSCWLSSDVTAKGQANVLTVNVTSSCEIVAIPVTVALSLSDHKTTGALRFPSKSGVLVKNDVMFK